MISIFVITRCDAGRRCNRLPCVVARYVSVRVNPVVAVQSRSVGMATWMFSTNNSRCSETPNIYLLIHFEPLDRTTVKNLKFQKFKMTVTAILKNRKLIYRYLIRGLSDFDKIWHSGAFRSSWPFRSLKMYNFKNPILWLVATTILKMPKSRYRDNSLTNGNRHEIWQWRSSALVTVWSVTNLRSKEIQDSGGRHPNNLNIMISRQRFDPSG